MRRDKPIAEHFCSLGHGPDDMGVCVWERIQDASRWYKRIKELGWIQKCKLKHRVAGWTKHRDKNRQFVELLMQTVIIFQLLVLTELI